MCNNLKDALLNCEMNYETSQNSFSPIYSDFGLGLDGTFAGVKALYLHYNRSTNVLWEPLLVLPGKITSYIPRADKVLYKTDLCESQIAFYDTDCFSVYCKTDCDVSLFTAISDSMLDAWVADTQKNQIIIQGYSENAESRDPDKEVAVMAGVRVIKGSLNQNTNEVSVSPVDGEILLAFSFDVLNVDICKIKNKLKNAPKSVDAAAEKTREWIAETVKDLELELNGDCASTVFVKAVITLIFNLAKASGNLEGCISSFPNRGGYPTHFMWDSCFQNLAYELMNIDIAKDSLLQLCQNIRPDGKIPQFLCSTWVRPHDTQPALLGWAAKRLCEKNKDIEFIKIVFDTLEKNNKWWLTQRITRFSVIKCADGLETGQDNSPRFDNGTVLAVDMNSYLLNQIKVTSEFAEILGLPEKAEYWSGVAEKLNGAMIKYLYDEEKNLFFDADAVTAEKQSLITSSGFIPLWAGVKIPEDKIKSMVNDWLLNPEHFYSNVPFPSVAYSQSVYDPKDWWRGPTWMPEAWLMLEVLEKYGFQKEFTESSQKLYDIILKDGVLHEHFNSATGEGMGYIEQGWTAAVFIKLYMMIKNK